MQLKFRSDSFLSHEMKKILQLIKKKMKQLSNGFVIIFINIRKIQIANTSIEQTAENASFHTALLTCFDSYGGCFRRHFTFLIKALMRQSEEISPSQGIGGKFSSFKLVKTLFNYMDTTATRPHFPYTKHSMPFAKGA